MPDFDGNSRFTRDTDHFVERLQDGGAFAALVGGVDPTVVGSLGGERNQFLRFGIRSGRILERSGNADSAVDHGLTDKLLHLVELSRCGLNVVIAENHAANRSGANVISNVDADALLFQASEVLAERLPVGLNAKEVESLFARAANSIIHWRNGFAFARDFRGDALIDF